MAEDRDLVALLKRGNIEALESLIQRWRPRAEAYARSFLHDPHAAEDAVQEAFSRIYALRTDLDPPSPNSQETEERDESGCMMSI